MTTLAEKVPSVFWPTIDRIDELIRITGVPLPQLGETLRQVALVDPDKLRAAAAVWGVNGKQGVPAEYVAGMDGDIARVTTLVGQRWEGDAWEQFNREMNAVRALIGKLGEPSAQVGVVLEEYADKITAAWEEIVGWVITIAGIVVMVVTWETGVGAVVGAIITVLGLILQAYQSIAPRFTTVKNAVDQLTGEIRDKIPGIDDSRINTPETGDWQQKTPDPNT